MSDNKFVKKIKNFIENRCNIKLLTHNKIDSFFIIYSPYIDEESEKEGLCSICSHNDEPYIQLRIDDISIAFIDSDDKDVLYIQLTDDDYIQIRRSM